jgi:hypothetical protein
MKLKGTHWKIIKIYKSIFVKTKFFIIKSTIKNCFFIKETKIEDEEERKNYMDLLLFEMSDLGVEDLGDSENHYRS